MGPFNHRFKNTLFYQKAFLRSGGRLLDLSTPKVMGIINLTPDSFYAESRFSGGEKHNVDAVLHAADQMIEEGAYILDLGAMSSRPGAEIIEIEEEKMRLLAPLREIRKRFPEIFISIDTVHSEVAKDALESGADMINDISAGDIDPKMIDLIAEYEVPYIIMHMKGIPSNMQNQVDYDDLFMEVLFYLKDKILFLKKNNIHDIIIDPGFGFGKDIDGNYDLLRKLHKFRVLRTPVLAGISRKSMLYKPLGINAEDALYPTIAANTIALEHGATILRVHDVKAAKQAIDIYRSTYAE